MSRPFLLLWEILFFVGDGVTGLSATSGKTGGLRKVGRLKAAWPHGRSCRCSSQRRRRGIFVVVKRQPTKRRQARHLRKPHPEYAAPPELGNSPRDTATMMPRPRRSHQLPLLPCAAGAKYSRKCQTSRVLRQSRRVSFQTKKRRGANAPRQMNFSGGAKRPA